MHATVEIPDALYIIAVAEHAEDREEYFPYGKWRTIQAIEGRIEQELKKLDVRREDAP